jgi:hypothetical protein
MKTFGVRTTHGPEGIGWRAAPETMPSGSSAQLGLPLHPNRMMGRTIGEHALTQISAGSNFHRYGSRAALSAF